MSLINCEISLTLTWFKICLITYETTRDPNPNADPVVEEIRTPKVAKFNITGHKIIYTNCYSFS